MTQTLRAHFDGKVIVPDEPVELPSGQELIVHVRSATPRPVGTPGTALREFAGSISDEDAKLMMKAIEEGCGRVDLSEW